MTKPSICVHRLSKNRFVHLFIEPNDQFFPDPQRRSSQIPGRTKDELKHLLLGWLVFLQIQLEHFFTFCCQQVIDLFEDLNRVGFLMRFFLCVDFGCGFDIGGGKKLLRFGASFSALAVVAPVKFRHSQISFLKVQIDPARRPFYSKPFSNKPFNTRGKESDLRPIVFRRINPARQFKTKSTERPAESKPPKQ